MQEGEAQAHHITMHSHAYITSAEYKKQLMVHLFCAMVMPKQAIWKGCCSQSAAHKLGPHTLTRCHHVSPAAQATHGSKSSLQ